MLFYTISPIAERELDDYAAYIAKDNLSAALRIYDAAEETFRTLAEFPKMGETYYSTNPQLLNIRFFPIKNFKNYLIFYQQIDKHIEIIRVLNKSTHINNILK